jgi:uncharacterized protein YggU (UPF0235/DUF167 family)
MTLTIRVRAQTAGSRVGGLDNGALVVRVGSARVDARATELALRAVAGAFGVRRSDVTLVNGVTGATKVVSVGGAQEADLTRRREMLVAA